MKRSVIVIGRTKSGKSTLCNLLSKEELISYNENEEILLRAINDNSRFNIG
jgi:GTPase Era involved in 16S rRNA processing